jgi:hypothetical protein
MDSASQFSISDEQIEEDLALYLAAFPGHRVARQYRVHDRQIDVVVHTGRELWAVEANSTDWRRAVAQARINLASVEKSFIAVHRPILPQVERVELDRLGIGLFAVGPCRGDCELLVSAAYSCLLNYVMADTIKAHLGRGPR